MATVLQTAPCTSTKFDLLLAKFIKASEGRDTLTFSRIEYPDELDVDRPVFPERLLSLYGHPIFIDMDAEVRWRLGLLETINFFSLNIHGEQALVAELAQRLYHSHSLGESPQLSRFLQHLIHEENSHTYMLAEFCNRYYGRVMPELVYRFDEPMLSRIGMDLLFFCRLYVLETLLDFVNRAAMCDDALEPTARAVHRSHHMDEAVHIAFDRAIITELSHQLHNEQLVDEARAVETLIRKYRDYAFSRLVNPRIYRELGIHDPLKVASEVRTSSKWLEQMGECTQQQDCFLRRAGAFWS